MGRHSVIAPRASAIVAAVALVGLMASCARERPARLGATATSTTATAAGVTTTAAAAPPGAALSEGAASGTTGRPRTTAVTRPRTTTTAAAGSPTGGSGSAGTTPQPGSGDVEPTAQNDGSTGPPGAFARTLLRPQPATVVVLERLTDGSTISQAAVDHSAKVVGDVSGKRVDVRAAVPLDQTAPTTDWSADAVRQAADRSGRIAQGADGRAVVRVLILKGRFEGNDEVLGVTVRGDVLAVFPERIAAAATPIVSRAAIEDAVLMHEFGHVLGLVDLARDTGRADKDHPGHSTNSASVMYWAVESSLVGQVLNGPPPRDFDRNDLADLAALRNGA